MSAHLPCPLGDQQSWRDCASYSDILAELIQVSHNLVVYRSLREDPNIDDVLTWLLDHATDPGPMDNVATKTPVAQDSPLRFYDSMAYHDHVLFGEGSNTAIDWMFVTRDSAFSLSRG